VLRLCLAAALVLQTSAAIHFDSNRAWEHLRQLVAIGPRPSGSPAIEQTRKYIKDQLISSGVAVTEQQWVDDTPAGKIAMVNLVATIPGARKDRIVIAGHYDTKRFPQFRFVGASDGGSSAAFVIELARVLKTRKNPLTIELLFLDGEEAVGNWSATDSTYGSRYYVQAAQQSGSLKSIKAFILLDMIGDRNLTIRRESNSTRWLTDIVWGAAKKLGHRGFMDEETTVEDDHIPFVKAGVPSLDIIDLDYPQWHTAQDTLDAVAARSLQVVGEVVVEALPLIEQRLLKQ